MPSGKLEVGQISEQEIKGGNTKSLVVGGGGMCVCLCIRVIFGSELDVIWNGRM